jgi:predicted flap endonuclease-1-like 5' DNA nuclease
MFEAQRSAMEAGRRMLEQGRSAQRNAADAMLIGLRAQETTQKQALELSRVATRNYLSAVEAAMPADGGDLSEVKRSVDEGFDEFGEIHGETFDAIEANLDSYEELSEEYVEALREGTETAVDAQRRVEGETVRSAERVAEEAIEAAEETTEAASETVAETAEASERVTQSTLDATEEVADTTVEATEESVEAATDATGEVAESTAEATEDAAEAATDIGEEVTRATEEATEAAAEAGEEVAESTAESVEETAENGAEATEAAAEDVAESTNGAGLDRRVHGIGDAHAESLLEAGVESLADLAEAQADAIAETAEISEEQAREWIDRAGVTSYAQDVDLVDGIGDAHAEDLRTVGIVSIADLAEADADRVAEGAGVSEEHAGEWIEDARSRQEEGLEVIDGIGESRAERLREAGIETLADLAASDANYVAEAAEVSEDRAAEWIEAATA